LSRPLNHNPKQIIVAVPAKEYSEPTKPDLKSLALLSLICLFSTLNMGCDSLSSHQKQGMQIAIKNECRVETVF